MKDTIAVAGKPLPKKPVVTHENLKEAKRLKALWERSDHGLTQAEFGAKWGIGKQATVSQFLNGVTPLSLRAALGFAQGLGCSISEFTPRLAAGITGLAKAADGSDPGETEVAMFRLATSQRVSSAPVLASLRGRISREDCEHMKLILRGESVGGESFSAASWTGVKAAVMRESEFSFCAPVPFEDGFPVGSSGRYLKDEFVLVDLQTDLHSQAVLENDWIYFVGPDETPRLLMVKAGYEDNLVMVDKEKKPVVQNMKDALLWGVAIHPVPAHRISRS